MSGLSPRQMFLLDNACWPLRHEFPGDPYLVGTAQVHQKGDPAPRDVDVRHILRDEEYAALQEAVGIEGIRFLGLAIGQYLASTTGLPVDFQFQQQSAANDLHAKPRNPLGIRGLENYAGDAEPRE